MPFHEEEECEKFSMNCHKCNLEMERGALMSHLDFDCEENEIRCKNYPRCNVKMKKRTLKDHVR